MVFAEEGFIAPRFFNLKKRAWGQQIGQPSHEQLTREGLLAGGFVNGVREIEGPPATVWSYYTIGRSHRHIFYDDTLTEGLKEFQM